MKEFAPIFVVIVVVLAVLITSGNNIFSDAVNPNVRGAKTQSGAVDTESEQEIRASQGVSPFAGSVNIDDVEKPGTFAGSEYIKVSSSANVPINMSGWSVVSAVSGNKVFVGNASPLPLIEQEKSIMLGKGQKMIIASAGSPINISFRTNICTGYIENKTQFSPSLPLKCPSLEDENLPSQIENNEECMDYLDSVPRCDDRGPDTFEVPNSCLSFVKENATYESCVGLHKNDNDFYGNEWRIFLKSNIALWRRNENNKDNQESIRLLDAQGLIVDMFNY